MTATVLVAIFASFCAGLVFTALVRALAGRIGLTDKPDLHRKVHPRATPLGGGAAILLAAAVVLAGLLLLPNLWKPSLEQNWLDLLSLFLACAAIVSVGLLDDCIGLRGRQKLVGQALAVLILIGGGLSIDSIEVFGWRIEFGLLTIPFTLFWLLGAVNAVNLLDGVDGLAATLGIILSVTIGIMALMTNSPQVAIVALVFAGSLAGFLVLNFPPASIFLGDGGSMLIGLVVGALAARGSLKGAGTVLLAAPLAVWAIPILDTGAAILRRKLSGRSIYTTDRSHLHHRLLELLGTNRRVLAAIAVCCGLTCAGAFASVVVKNDLIALASCAGVVIVLVASGVFGRIELQLLAHRCHSFGLSLASGQGPESFKPRQTCIRLQGSANWDLLWARLAESAGALGLRRVHLDLNMPARHEEYAATWERPSQDDFEQCWQVDLPLVAADQPVGRLTLSGDRNGGSAYQEISRLQALIESFEAELTALAAESSDEHASARRRKENLPARKRRRRLAITGSGQPPKR